MNSVGTLSGNDWLALIWTSSSHDPLAEYTPLAKMVQNSRCALSFTTFNKTFDPSRPRVSNFDQLCILQSRKVDVIGVSCLPAQLQDPTFGAQDGCGPIHQKGAANWF